MSTTYEDTPPISDRIAAVQLVIVGEIEDVVETTLDRDIDPPRPQTVFSVAVREVLYGRMQRPRGVYVSPEKRWARDTGQWYSCSRQTMGLVATKIPSFHTSIPFSLSAITGWFSLNPGENLCGCRSYDTGSRKYTESAKIAQGTPPFRARRSIAAFAPRISRDAGCRGRPVTSFPARGRATESETIVAGTPK